jgi:hypothetical protein
LGSDVQILGDADADLPGGAGMPTTAAVGDVWQVIVRQKIENQDCLNIHHFQAITSISDVETTLLLALIQCLEAFAPIRANTFKFEGLQAKQVTPILGPLIEQDTTTGFDIMGEGVGDAGVSFNSAVVSIHTTRGGRSGRGRMYIGGLPESATVGSNFVSNSEFWLALVAYLACVAGKFIRTTNDPNVGQVWDLGVVSRKLGGAKPPFTAGSFARATSLQPNMLVKSTISRKVGRGS